jgi:hypothetical protein
MATSGLSCFCHISGRSVITFSGPCLEIQISHFANKGRPFDAIAPKLVSWCNQSRAIVPQSSEHTPLPHRFLRNPFEHICRGFGIVIAAMPSALFEHCTEGPPRPTASAAEAAEPNPAVAKLEEKNQM